MPNGARMERSGVDSKGTQMSRWQVCQRQSDGMQIWFTIVDNKLWQNKSAKTTATKSVTYSVYNMCLFTNTRVNNVVPWFALLILGRLTLAWKLVKVKFLPWILQVFFFLELCQELLRFAFSPAIRNVSSTSENRTISKVKLNARID